MSFVHNNEILARFILSKSWVRADKTVKPDAFIPYPYPDLSVTRHTNLSESEIWQLGTEVAKKRNEKDIREIALLGRADLIANHCYSLDLDISPAEPPRNHANIKGWPSDKAAQKMIALQLARNAKYFAFS